MARVRPRRGRDVPAYQHGRCPLACGPRGEQEVCPPDGPAHLQGCPEARPALTGSLQQSPGMEKSRRASPALFMPGRGPACRTGRDGGYRFQALAEEPGLRPFQERNGWSEAHKESPKAFVHCCAPPQVERNCHRALTALTNGRDSLKAHPAGSRPAARCCLLSLLARSCPAPSPFQGGGA